jgi:uncharacterized protein involved in outer membrane biogenesis
VQIKILPLLRGQVILPFLAIDKADVRLLRDKDGKANWTFGAANQRQAAEAARRPALRDQRRPAARRRPASAARCSSARSTPRNGPAKRAVASCWRARAA